MTMKMTYLVAIETYKQDTRLTTTFYSYTGEIYTLSDLLECDEPEAFNRFKKFCLYQHDRGASRDKFVDDNTIVNVSTNKVHIIAASTSFDPVFELVLSQQSTINIDTIPTDSLEGFLKAEKHGVSINLARSYFVHGGNIERVASFALSYPDAFKMMVGVIQDYAKDVVAEGVEALSGSIFNFVNPQLWYDVSKEFSTLNLESKTLLDDIVSNMKSSSHGSGYQLYVSSMFQTVAERYTEVNNRDQVSDKQLEMAQLFNTIIEKCA